ncbi:MAG TPA: hypothetical protein VG253_10680 [Streptosporangiaceae bacterium]|nr:hypothetical protein [Streptosporangiaceae bacterium]
MPPPRDISPIRLIIAASRLARKGRRATSCQRTLILSTVLGLHHFHQGDTYHPVEPAAFLTRLQTVGFGEVTLTVNYGLMFRARKPGAPQE